MIYSNSDIEASIGMKDEIERSSLIEETLIQQLDQPIDNHDTSRNHVILLDISDNKQWMTYVTHRREDTDMPGYPKPDKVYKTYLTRRRFTAVTVGDEGKEITLENGYQISSNNDRHFSIEITRYLHYAGQNHCKFLSISQDGNYIALSFYERNPTHNSMKPAINNQCFIFEITTDGLQKKTFLECSGRAVFLTDDKNTLAFIDADNLTYGNFSASSHDNTVFDINIFKKEGGTPELPEYHKPYIKNSPWLEYIGENEDIKKVITFTRHIRHGIIVTPFQSGIVRVWSIKEKGVRWTSFNVKGEHIMAFSKDYKFTAAYVEVTRSVNIYNVKSGLLVYRLKPNEINQNMDFEVSHIRFCYGGRYVSMSGWEGNNVIFEVWYLEAERSIYRISKSVGKRSIEYAETKLKVFEPFVTRGYNSKEEKCLMGLYMSYDDNQLKTRLLELDIDANKSEATSIDWIESVRPRCFPDDEIQDNLRDFDNVKCGYVLIGGVKHLIRFGMCTIQIWKLDPNGSKDDCIGEKDILIYIRAYKGPDYGLDYSFRETWRICKFETIKFIEDNGSGRLLVNITETSDGGESTGIYHTEEIFLPSDGTDNEGGFDYHKLESACQAMHYLFKNNHYENKKNMAMLRIKTQALVESAVNMIDTESNFFSTPAGSKTLAMLASFKEGTEIIKLIVKKDVPISIFSYQRPLSEIKRKNSDEIEAAIEYWDKNYKSGPKEKNNESNNNYKSGPEEKSNESDNNSSKNLQITYRSSDKRKMVDQKPNNFEIMATNENILTVLIEDSNYDLFKLIFNRILLDSKKLGPGCLSALTDALVFLQEGNSDLLLSSSQKLSYLHIDVKLLGILNFELNDYIKSYTVRQEGVIDLQNPEPHAVKEELKYINLRREILLQKLKTYIQRSYPFFEKPKLFVRYIVWKYFTGSSPQEVRKSLRVCVIPLPHFNTYSNFPEDIKYTDKNKSQYKSESAFTRIASNQHSNNIFRQGDTIFEVLLEYKWKAFARKKFILICFIHAVYYVSYSTGVLFSRNLYVKEPDNEFDMKHPGHITSLVLMGISLATLMIQELRQFFNTQNKMDYIWSGYNWIDMAAFTFPIFTVLQSLLGWDCFSEVCCITTLILWAHGILRLRVISYFGIALEIIIQLFRKIFSTLFVMLLVIFAFTMSFIVLLNLKEDEFFQDNFSGNFVSESGEGSIETANISADNGFSNWFKAFSQVWFFIYGVWDPVIEGDAGDSKMVMALCILFSFVTVLIFFNMIIALMSSTVEDVGKLGKRVWVSHFAAVVSEIELFWCSKNEKRKRKNNPAYIYYIAKKDDIIEQEEKLKKETSELLKKLHIVSDSSIHVHP